MNSQRFSVLILGGYGNFGKRISELLAKDSSFKITIAGRSQVKGESLAKRLKDNFSDAQVDNIVLDVFSHDLEKIILEKNIKLVIHTCGPFQGQDYTVANACINTKTHYIDLADDRRFVCDFNQLDESAREKDILLVSGASSVPGLSSTVINYFSNQLNHLDTISIGITPGNKAERGYATLKAILSYTGHQFSAWKNAGWQSVYGWQDLTRHDFGKPLGVRWMANCDIPDLELLPKYFPDVNNVTFQAGLELKLFHFSMWLMSWCCRLKFANNWARYTDAIFKLSHYFDYFGNGDGGMFIRLTGNDNENKPCKIEWTLIAENYVGPYIPAIPAVILAKKIANRDSMTAGAIPCINLFSIDEFDALAKQWNIYHRTTTIG